MRGWRERAIGRIGHASGGAIRARNFCLGWKNQPSGISRPTGNNSTSAFSRFPRGRATECAVRAAVPAAPRRAARGLRWGRAEPTAEEQHIGTAGRSEEMTLVDGEKAVERALDTAADGGGGSPVFRMRGPGREDTGLPISRESREPRAESREPRAESREPRAESREPRAESREPRAESREPRAESREPRAESREPRAESREPRAESREPRAESREPRAESREPRAESREPRAESREPRARELHVRRGASCLG